MSSIDLDDDLIYFTIDSLDDDDDDDENDCSCTKSDLSTYANSSPVEPIHSTSNTTSDNKKMSDITDFLDSTDINDKQESLDLISTTVLDYLHTNTLQNDQNNYEKNQLESEENYLKSGSKQLSPSDYLTRKSLYNRPVAFEKDSRVWARSLLDNFKKSNQNCKSKSSSLNFTYYLPIVKKSSSFDHHVQYIEHLNECNDYPAYLEYLKENRSELLYTLTDSIDIIEGLIGTVV
ncbi:unnamed protein product [Rotaria socialis]|uniref:Uncharacterized protein n=1 Tax=Rotaria socialis TaxID=392032 RepID=A0A818IFJ7_9BILA|nr:unnamed protein product [Rotaria socialis]CAF3524628.1 unnamed protein product [Rotaria socialis]CAF4245983.1 unnamed protein product [Rotaria socialis]CAF4511764.1 unnamed protein product [Rotaria socialis]